MPEPTVAALRAYVELPDERQKRGRTPHRRRAKYVLFIDAETTTDRSQRLTFGFYRYCRLSYPPGAVAAECVEEGLFHADELPEHDPAGFAVLREFVASTPADVAGAPRKIRFLRRTEFVDQVLYYVALKVRGQLCFFNASFDIPRLAVRASEARSKSFRGGFSFVIWTYRDANGDVREHTFRPRIDLKNLDSKRALIGFTTPRRGEGDRAEDGDTTFRGHFLDLRTLTYALTNQSHTLASAGAAFGVAQGKLSVAEHGVITPDYVRYARRDVEATSRLYERVMAEFERHPIDLQETKAFSPASIGKAYLRALGVLPRQRR